MPYPYTTFSADHEDGLAPTDTNPLARLDAADVNAIETALNQLKTVLGSLPQGVAADLTARLTALDSTVAAHPADTTAAHAGTALSVDGTGFTHLSDLIDDTQEFAEATDVALADLDANKADTADLAALPFEPQATIVTVADLGAAYQIDVTDETYLILDGTLTQNCAITFTGWTVGTQTVVDLNLHQNNPGGGWLVTWPTIDWVKGDFEPVLRSPAGALTKVRVESIDGGTTLIGAHGGEIQKVVWSSALSTDPVTGIFLHQVDFATDFRVLDARLRSSTAPTTTGIRLDVLKNGSTSLYSADGDKPIIAATATTSSVKVPTVASAARGASGDYIVGEIETIGAAGSGRNVVVTVRVLVA